MLAYKQGITKGEFVNEMKRHQRLDNLTKGTYGHGVKGCAVGCGISSINKLKSLHLRWSDHSQFETYLGIPEWLARVEDVIFQGVSLKRSKKWPVEFSQAIISGVDLNQIKIPFITMILNSNIEVQECLLKGINDKNIREIIINSIKVNKQMVIAQESGDRKLINLAQSAVWSAVWSASESAAQSAVQSSESALWSASWSATESSGSAAESARSAAKSVLWSAEEASEVSIWAAESIAWSAEAAAYEKYADKLLELLRGCKKTK